MKTQTLMFPICAAFVLAFFGCAKKQASAEAKTDASSESETQSEYALNDAIEGETQLAETGFVLDGELLQENPEEKGEFWNEEDTKAINKMKKQLRETSKNDLTICRPEGTYLLYYSNNEKTVRPPVTSITDVDLKMNGEAAYVRFSSCLNSKASNKITCHSTDYATAIALEEEGKDDNILTLLFSNDQAKTWNTAYIEIASEYLGGEKYPRYDLLCTDSNTGYLMLRGIETIVIDGGYSGKSVPGAHIFRTQDAGVSWQELEEIKPNLYDHFFMQEDGTLDTERYSSVKILGFCFEGKYGIIRFSYPINDEDVRKSGYFATKDGGESWIVWDK